MKKKFILLLVIALVISSTIGSTAAVLDYDTQIDVEDTVIINEDLTNINYADESLISEEEELTALQGLGININLRTLNIDLERHYSVQGDNVRLRKTASTSGTIITSASWGAQFVPIRTVLVYADGHYWAYGYLKSDGRYGYIAVAYLR